MKQRRDIYKKHWSNIIFQKKFKRKRENEILGIKWAGGGKEGSYLYLIREDTNDENKLLFLDRNQNRFLNFDKDLPAIQSDYSYENDYLLDMNGRTLTESEKQEYFIDFE